MKVGKEKESNSKNMQNWKKLKEIVLENEEPIHLC